MGLLAPLALIFLPLLAVIAAFYLLRLRRPETAVSSLHLWETLLRDREANAPWQRLRTNLLLLLQLLIVAALILALARPWSTSDAPGGRNLVIVLDTSASMGATDAARGATRLAQAKQEALSRVAQLPGNGQATLITAGTGARVVLAGSNDETAIRKALDGVTVEADGTDLREALTLAAALAARQPDSEVAVFSDGRFPDPRADTPVITGTVAFRGVGQRGDNQGVVSLSLRRNAGSISLFVQVLNAAEREMVRRLDITLDGKAWAGRELTLAPGDTQAIILDDVPLDAQVVHARLAGADDLAVDDEAWTINRLAEPSPVLLVTDGNRFLQNALVLLPNVALERSRTAEYAPAPTATLTVFDSFVPTGTLPAGNLLFIAPPHSTALFDVLGVMTNPTALAPDVGAAAATGGGEPLLRFLDLSELHIARAGRVPAPNWGHVVLDSDQGPLLIAGETEGRKVVILTFDLHDSDLPIQMSFPLLMRNLTGYLLPEPAGGLPPSVAAGAAVPISPDPSSGVTRITVEPPGAAMSTTFAVDAAHTRFTYADTRTLGVYVVSQWVGEQVVRREGFAVNLANAEESRTLPRLSPPLPVGATDAAPRGEPARVEWWPLLAVAALLVLLVEWLMSHQMALRGLGARFRAWRARRRHVEAP
jgi:hypothetical protein